MALSKITSGSIANGTVVAADIAANAITTVELANSAVQANNIQDGAVTNSKLGSDVDLGINPLFFTGT